MSDHEGYDLDRDDANQGVGIHTHPWDSPTRRSIFRPSRDSSRVTARPGANPDGHDTARGGSPSLPSRPVSPTSSTKE